MLFTESENQRKKLEPFRRQLARGKVKTDVDLKRYSGLIWKVSWTVWRQLPTQTRTWISVEDVHQIANFHVQHHLFPYWLWSGQQSAFSTLLVNKLQHHLMNVIVDPFVTVAKRCDTNTVSIQAMEQKAKEDGQRFDMERVLGMRAHVPNMMDCHVSHAFPKMHSLASEKLQDSIEKWFLDQQPPLKLHTKTKEFKELSREFRRLAKFTRVTLDDCLHLVRSPVCLDRVSRTIRDIPFSLTMPAPDADRGSWLTLLS